VPHVAAHITVCPQSSGAAVLHGAPAAPVQGEVQHAPAEHTLPEAQA
jgi:hypothetical protein